jgi:hypothetical protein
VLATLLNLMAPTLASFMFPSEPVKFCHLLRILTPVMIFVPIGVAYGGMGLVVVGAMQPYLWAIAAAEMVGFVTLFIGFVTVPETYGAWTVLVTEIAVALFMAIAFVRHRAANANPADGMNLSSP